MNDNEHHKNDHSDDAHSSDAHSDRPLDDHARSVSHGTDPHETIQPAHPATEPSAPSCPQQIGRYRVERLLGVGGFGQVYLAQDTQLERFVAIKVPHAHLVARREVIDEYFAEARILAALDHEHIVPVYDAGSTDKVPCFVVSKYVEGTDLARFLKRERLSHDDTAELIATVAEALHYAHTCGLVHRDVKPGNILLGQNRKPYVVDFGLALKEADLGQDTRFAGTPAYMSPEQASGEGHRVDGRSDVYSLGAVLYELLVGRRPFSADSHRKLLELTATQDPKPPRQINDRVPKDLERICLKALARRASDRYTTALDMSDDLRQFLTVPQTQAMPTGSTGPALTTPRPTDETHKSERSDRHTPSNSQVDSRPLHIVPKGLRSFDEHDADFFLELLPGPCDRDGLPDNIRFWKTKIEAMEVDRTFFVGLLYGPSGCGKSSLVKAGLLPHLAPHVKVVFVEATPEQTETRLLCGLRRRCPSLSPQLGLRESLLALRRGEGLAPGQKVLIIVDQFEQWLHANRAEENTALQQALRQCDGERVQCLLMVRDDFWLAVSRFMRALEVRLVEGSNSALVDLFDPRHAKRVLAAFGRAYGVLPDASGAMTREQQQFLQQAVQGLQQDSKVICVRLGLFAEMIKDRPWNPTTLKEVGGASGVGAAFLDATFSSSSAPPEHRIHRQAAQAVLRSLLPDAGSDIVGSMRSYDVLLEASGYAHRREDFGDVIRILDSELRLITPTDPDGADARSEKLDGSNVGLRYYQLTHDYLVPSLRDWMTRTQQATRRGRAELRLAERARLWNTRPQNRHLPSLWEHASIRTLTNKRHWTPPQQRMMRSALFVHGRNIAVFLVLLVTLIWLGYEGYGINQSKSLIRSLVSAEIEDVPTLVDELRVTRRWSEKRLQQLLVNSDESPKVALRASLALLESDESRVPYLQQQLLSAAPREFQVIRQMLMPYARNLVDSLWKETDNQDPERSSQRFRAACALAAMDADNPRWQQIADDVVAQLIRVRPAFVSYWQEMLVPVGPKLAPALSAAFQDPDLTSIERGLATGLLADYASTRPDVLAEVIQYADAQQFEVFMPLLENCSDLVVPRLEASLDTQPRAHWTDTPTDPAWEPPAESLIKQIEAADGLMTDRFAFCSTMRLKDVVAVAQQLKASGYRPVRIRPFALGPQLHAAVIWKRDGSDFETLIGTAADIRQRDQDLQADQWRATDVASFSLKEAGPAADVKYCVVWAPAKQGESARRLTIGTHLTELDTLATELENAGYNQITNIAMTTIDDKTQLVSAIWRKTQETFSTYDKLGAGYSGASYPLFRQLDVAVRHSTGPQGTPERFRREIAEADAVLATAPLNVNARFKRAMAYYRVNDLEQALDEFQWLAERFPDQSDVWLYRALVECSLGDQEAAEAAAGKFRASGSSESDVALLDVLIAIHFTEDNQWAEQLEKEIAAQPDDTQLLLDTARIYAIATRVLAREADRARHTERAVELIQQAIDRGFSDYSEILDDPDFHWILENEAMVRLLRRGDVESHYTAIFSDDPNYESSEIHGLDPGSALLKAKELIAADYRPTSISVCALRPDRLNVALVFDRPVPQEELKERLGKGQANTATALLRLGHTEAAWQTLAHSDDPRARSYLIDRLPQRNIDPQVIIDRIELERQPSIRRALILALGNYRPEQISAQQRSAMTEKLLNLYRTDPDPGLHAAARWTLTEWGHRQDVADIDTRLAQREPQLIGKETAAQPRWYVNSQLYTMIVLQGERYLMGAPRIDSERQSNESIRWKNVKRRFAIAATETTLGQWRTFAKNSYDIQEDLVNNDQIRYLAVNDNSPMMAVTWYEAAAYCNWLSKTEGIDEEQWCYERNQDGRFIAGMHPKRNYLQLSGYRLPTEAEWEFACRAGARTARHYGQTDELLPQYAWYMDNSGGLGQATASLMPNDFGAFDMLGGVWEWGDESANALFTTNYDLGDPSMVRDDIYRVMCGGGFNFMSPYQRSAAREYDSPNTRQYSVGFRVTRTMPD